MLRGYAVPDGLCEIEETTVPRGIDGIDGAVRIVRNAFPPFKSGDVICYTETIPANYSAPFIATLDSGRKLLLGGGATLTLAFAWVATVKFIVKG